ncbi:MAG: DUF5668 domain-containing protein [Chloroflexota bacterium]|nr:DUF5668 domain-containing protein [Chloroflexota bacterium]MDE2896710.1 DUF5668 domain-containing protein [Chloroflexota bacterium]
MARNNTPDDSAPTRKRRRRRRGDGALVGGTALVLLGSVFLADELGWVEFGDLWPVILIGIGLVMIFTYLADARRSQ